MSWRRLENVLKTSSRCLEDVFARRLEDVLKTYDQDEYIGLDQDVLKTSSEDLCVRWIYSSWSRRLEDVFIKTNVCWVTYQKSDISDTTKSFFSQDKMEADLKCETERWLFFEKLNQSIGVQKPVIHLRCNILPK